MANFKIAFELTSQAEGGYSNSQYDKGGETWRGISRVYHPNWQGWQIIDQYKSQYKNFVDYLWEDDQLNQLVIDFYKQNFWDVMNLDNCNSQLIANELYDTGVNMGNKIAAQFLQVILNRLNKKQTLWTNIAEDGKIGNQTINTLHLALTKHAQMEIVILRALNCLQGARYISITSEDSNNEMNLLGWLLHRVVI